MNQIKSKNNNILSRRNSSAFTLLELIVTMTIAGILATMAIPSFNAFLESSRLTANTNLVIGALNLARSEAIRLGESVRVEEVGSSEGMQLVIASGADIGEVIKQFTPSSKDITYTVSNVTYQSTGFRTFGNTAVTYSICDSQGNGSDIVISVGGSVTSEESATC